MSTGLNGWFGRRLKELLSFAGKAIDTAVSKFSLKTVESNFEEYAQDLGSQGGGFWNRLANNNSNTLSLEELENDTRGNYEPTDNELPLLEKFSNEIATIIANLVIEKSALLNTYQSTGFAVESINVMLQKIAIIKEYYKFNIIGALSQPAVEMRNLMIEILLHPIIKEIEDLGYKHDNYHLNNVLINIPKNDLIEEIKPFERITSVVLVPKYLQFEPISVINPIELIPPKDPIEVFPIDNPIDTIETPIFTDIINPVDETPHTTTTNESKKSSFPWLLLIAGFVGYKILK